MGQGWVPVAQAWPAGVPCPPPNWPPNTPLPCTPNGIGATNNRPPEKGSKDAGAKGGDSKDAGAALPAGVKTLERQAVDYVAAGDTAKAAAAYEELVRRDPNNKVYAEAAASSGRSSTLARSSLSRTSARAARSRASA